MKSNDDYGQPIAPGEIRIMRTLPGPVERLWQYLTDPEKRARWFAGGPMEQRVGGKVELFFHQKSVVPDEIPPEQFREMHEHGKKKSCTILRWEPPRVLSYTFDDESDVTFELIPQDQEDRSVLLILTHRSRGGDLPHLTGYASGWHIHLTMLVSILNQTPRPPFWATFLRLKSDYEKLLQP